MDPNHEMLADIFRMTKENNQLLHSMRRHALIGGFLKFVIYIIIIVAPFWFYFTYLNTNVQKMLTAFTQLQTTGTNAQAQLAAFQKSIADLQSKIPGFPHATTTKSTQ